MEDNNAEEEARAFYGVNSSPKLIYKALYPEAVRLEGLRLLKYADKFG